MNMQQVGKRETSPRAVGLTCVRFLTALAVGDGDPLQAAGFAQAQKHWLDRGPVVAALRSAVDALDPESAAALVAPIASDLWQLIAPALLIERLGLRELPLNVRTVFATDEATAGWGRPKAISAAAFDTALLDPLTVSAASVTTLELTRAGGSVAERALREALRRAVVAALNGALVDGDAGETGKRPASIAAGAPSVPSSGSTVAAVTTDLQAAIASLLGGGGDVETAWWVLNPRTAVALGTLRDSGGALAFPYVHARGGTLLGVPAVVSSAVPITDDSSAKTSVLLVDSARIAFARGPVEFAIARHASIQMSDSPTTGATTLVNLWERNLTALRAELAVNWRALSGAVVAITGVEF